MLRSSLIAAGSVILCTAAAAQSVELSGVMPIQKAPQFGGTYHVATGTWTRNTPDSAVLGVTDVVYNNTANTDGWTTGAIGSMPTSFQFVDEGRIPSTGSAGTANRDNYNLNTITIGYCSNVVNPNALDVAISIYGSYVPCTDPADPLNASCSGQFLGTGLPGANAADIANGYATCWTVDFDLSGGGEICLLGDGDGVFDSDLDFDSFGIGMEFDPGGSNGYVGIGGGLGIGPMLAGDRNWTVQAAGEIMPSAGAGVAGCATAAVGGGGDTYYGPAECCVPTVAGDNSSGLDQQDFNWVGDRSALGAAAGCYWFGGYDNTFGCNADGGMNPQVLDAGGAQIGGFVYAGFYTKLEADQSTNCVPTDCGGGSALTFATFCDPANNNSTGAPVVLSGTDNPGVESELHLEMTGGPTGQLAYMLGGNEATAGFAIPNTGGPLCLVGTATASLYRFNVSGGAMNSIGGFDATGTWINAVGTSTTGFGYDVATTIPDTVPITIMSGDTWHFQGWYRDSSVAAGYSNFSNGLSVTWP